MEKNKSVKTIIILAVIAAVVFAAIFTVINLTQNANKTKNEISAEKAMDRLEKLYKNIDIETLDLQKSSVALEADDGKDSLPDISKYPAQVEKTTEDFIEIFTSPEKAGKTYESWLIDVANRFNSSGAKVNGKPVSVRIRNIASGLGVDYISTQKYVPDAFTPSNELWGEMLKAKGVTVTLTEKRLVGNVAGMLFSKDKNKAIIEKYGAVNLKNVNQAVIGNELSMGYTNPFASSSGLNFLVSTLSNFDSKNPLSDTAVGEFVKFQTNIPFVAYTTMQMRDSAQSGALDGFILEYQSYVNTPEIKADYVFTPYGVRHDNPLYEIGNLSEIKKEIVKQFGAFCKTEQSQKLASEYGFNNLDSYKYELPELDGEAITSAQKIWKEKKNGENDIAAVFVADTSGSMDGAPLNKLKESLLKGSKYIGKDNSIGLVTFSSDVKIALPIAKFDINQRSFFTGAVQKMTANGGTAMFDGITVAIKMLMEEKQKNPNAKLMLFVLTDGETNEGHSLNDTRDMIKGLKIPIYSIGYNANISVLETVSKINEAASINADTDDVVYKLENLFNAQM